MKSDNKKELKYTLYVELMTPLQKAGFSRSKGSNKCVRKHDDRVDIFQLVWLGHNEGWRIQFNAGIRYDRVENILHETSGFQEQYRKGTSTVGAAIGVTAGSTARSCEYVLESSAQVDLVAEKIISLYGKFATPYFNRWSTLESIDEELNEEPSKKVPYLRGGLSLFRCSIGIIVAKLVGRANYEELASFYMDVMKKDNNGFYFKYFDPLMKSIKTLPTI